jgi:phospholipase/carboxylesterase
MTNHLGLLMFGGRSMMKHIFNKGTNPTKPTLLLLHGTGGNELDLLPLAGIIDDEASVLSVRGNVLENGMPRFFRRLAEGVFDEEDLIFRTKELNEFLDEAAEKYNFARDNIIAVGYSNGANIAASLLFHYQNAVKGAILHHPMVPRKGVDLPDLSGKAIFIAAGTNDPICSPMESTELHSFLTKAHANVVLHWENRGHQLTMEEVEAAAKWYKGI